MKIKVLMIDIGGWGGITHYTYNLMQALSASSDLDCRLITDRDYELDDLPRNFSVVKLALNNQPYITSVMRVLRTVLAFKPEIIHVQTMFSARKDWFLFFLARFSGIKVVFTAHNVLPHEDSEKQAWLMFSAFKIIYSCSSLIIVHSKFSQDKLSRLFSIPLKKIRVIAHGNYLFFRTREMSRQEARQSLGLGTDKRIIMQFGALREYKGIDLLLEAFIKVRQKNNAAFLLIVGKPINLNIDSIKQKIRACNLEQDVLFQAEYIPFSRLAAYFFSADVLVFPYKEIDMSGSLQLAYAFAKPVVCARSGGLPEVVSESKNGLLVQPNDIPELAESLLRLLSSDQLIRDMGEESLRKAKEEFSWGAIASSTTRVYQDMLGR